MRQTVDGKLTGLAFLLEDEQQSGPFAVRPFQQQGCVEFTVAIAQTLFQLLLTNGCDLGQMYLIGFLIGKKAQGFPGVIQNQVFEVLVVHGDFVCRQTPHPENIGGMVLRLRPLESLAIRARGALYPNLPSMPNLMIPPLFHTAF